MANVVINFTADTQAFDDINAKISDNKAKLEDLTKEYRDLNKTQKEAMSAAGSDEKTRAQDLLKYEKAIVDTKKEIGNLAKANKELAKSLPIEAANQSIRTYIMNLRETLTQMKVAGKTGTEEYKKLTDELSKLKEAQIGINREMKNMVSATRGFDTVLESTRLVAGGFSVLTGSMALFGGESEDVQKIMLKLQSAIAVTTGLQSIQSAVIKESNIMMGINVIQTRAKAAAEALSTKGTIAATVAQKAFNLVANANPYVLLATALITVVGALAAFTIGSKEADESAKKYRSTLDGMQFSTQKAADAHDGILKKIRDLQVEIDLVNGKITEYQANLLKINNKTVDAFQDIDDELKKEIDDINKEYQGFFAAVGKSLSILWDEGKSLSFAEIEQRRLKKIEEANQRAAQKKQDIRNVESKEEEKASADEVKRQISKYSSIAKERERYEKNINDKLAEEHLKAIKDDEAREALRLKQQYEKKFEAIKGNSEKEKELRSQLEDNMASGLQAIRDKYDAKRLQSQLQTELNTSNSRLSILKEGEEEYVREKENNLKIIAGIEAASVMNSEVTEEEKSCKLVKINNKLISDLKSLWDGYSKDYQKKSIEDVQIAADEQILVLMNQYANGEIKRKDYYDRIRQIDLNALQAQRDLLLEHGQSTLAIDQQIADQRAAAAEEAAEKRKNVEKRLGDALVNAASSISNSLFSIQSNRLSQQLSDLRHFYTTDAEEAKKNADLKLVSEEEMAARELEIRRKQAENEKKQAIFNVLLSTAQSIMKTAASVPTPWNIPLIALAAAVGAAQLAAVQSQQLPTYWKGRKGGQGEYALVGEQGPEIMYVPKGASIMPSHDTRRALFGNTDMMDKWNMPRFDYPVAPVIPQHTIDNSKEINNQLILDYDKLGSAVASHQKAVSINFDKSGLSIKTGNSTTKYANKRSNV